MSEKNDKEKMKELANAIVDECLQRAQIWLGKGLLNKLAWLFVVVLVVVGLKFGIVEIPSLK